ncbi:MAG: sialidase family protein [Fimbriimonadaceae bacterium]
MMNLRLFSVLGLSGLALLATAQRFGPEVEELERGSDPPAPPRKLRFSPQSVITFGNYTSYQANVNSSGFNILSDAANEPSIAVDPTNPNRMAIGWRQFDNVTSNFRQAGWAHTLNGGHDWTFPGNLQPGVFRSDPVLDVTSSGDFYYLSLQSSFFDDLYSSFNQGATWSLVGPATGGDKQWMIVDKTGGVGHGNIYQIWSTAGNNYGGRQFSRTTNAGLNWMDPINIPLQPVWGVLDIASNGDLYIGGSNGGSNFFFVRSSNAKFSSMTPTFDRSVTLSLGGSVGVNVPVNPAGLMGQVSISTDKSTSPQGGNIYMLSSVRTNATNPSDVKFVRSTNGGLTWSTPKKLNDDPAGTTRYHWMAAMSIAPNGRIDAVWNDTRANAANQFSALYYTCSFDGGDTWLPNTQVSPAFNHGLGYPNQNKMGDYLGLVSDNGGAHVAYCGTFNGEEDIYYLRIPAPEAIAPSTVALVRGLNPVGSVADVAWSENLTYSGNNDPTLNRTEPPIQIEVTGSTTILHPTRFRFKLENRISVGGLNQTISLFNVLSNQYEAVDTRAGATSDAVVVVEATGNLDRFINQSTGQVKAKLSITSTSPTLPRVWGTSIDHAQWVILN